VQSLWQIGKDDSVGWGVVEEYKCYEFAEKEEDDKKMRNSDIQLE